MVSRGKFIVFEGCDRSGKTTQCELAVEALKIKNIQTEYLKFPDRSTYIGSIINDYLTGKLKLSDKQIHFLFSFNRKELVACMESKLTSGCTLVVDRYSFSGIVYSSIKPDMDLTFCCLTEVGLLKPDLVLYLDGSVAVRSGRGGFGDEVYEKLDTQLRVEEAYRKLFFPCMQVVNGEGGVEEVHRRVMQCLDQQVASSTTTEPLYFFSTKDFNLEDGEIGATMQSIQLLTKEGLALMEESRSQEEAEKESLLKRFESLLTTVFL